MRQRKRERKKERENRKEEKRKRARRKKRSRGLHNNVKKNSGKSNSNRYQRMRKGQRTLIGIIYIIEEILVTHTAHKNFATSKA